jgi:hypothetical protein
MWKIALGFVVFAALALYVLFKGGDIDMGGEKHGTDAAPAPAQTASMPSPVAAPASRPTSAP